MHDFSYTLGDAVKCARDKLGFTQSQVADLIDADVRTILNIENYKGNPKMEILYPLIRTLNIDPREIFTPELQRDSQHLYPLRLLVESCTVEEADVVMPIFQSILDALRTHNATPIK